jgi:tripartite-type tricarboxylate transporter receptor subunit TctC
MVTIVNGKVTTASSVSRAQHVSGFFTLTLASGDVIPLSSCADEADPMKFPRRTFLHLVSGAIALSAASRLARAEAYPSRPVRVVVGFPPGFATDIIARLIAEALSERLGQQVIVDNRPGAGANIGADNVVRSPPDGYTLLAMTVTNAVNETLYTNIDFDFVRDIKPVASTVRSPNVLVVNPSLPTNTVPEFIAYAKANPGKINFVSGGNGSAGHMAGELFKMMAGVDMVHVPYRTSFVPDLLSGQVQSAFTPIPLSIAYIRDGKLRALGVAGTAPSDALPGIPTVAEFVPGYVADFWHGIGAPKDTPAEIVGTINTAVNAALADPAMKAKFASLGAAPAPMTPAAFGTFIAAEVDKWAKVVKFAGVKAE